MLNNSRFKLTQEQQIILDFAKTCQNFKIIALAGTGKTTTLKHVAHVLPRNGQYIAFNREIVNSAKRIFPHTVTCNTAHSLAFHTLGNRYSDRLNRLRRFSKYELTDWLQTKDFLFTSPVGERKCPAVFMAQLAQQTVKRFCKSADTSLLVEHIPRVPLLFQQTRQELAEIILPLAQRIWIDLQSTTGTLQFGHDHYLKIWQLTAPQIAGDYILFDEAQDADPVMLAVISQQDAQLIFCGDSYQSIYEWRGAIDALDRALPDANALYLTQSFRFGQRIADEANAILTRLQAPKPIIGAAHWHSTVAPIQHPDVVLCRTNCGVMSNLLAGLAQHQRVAIVGDMQPLITFIKACQQLQRGERTTHPELAPLQHWQDVLDWVATDPDEAGEIASLVRLINQYGTDQLLAALTHCTTEANATCLISTVHQAKGREWATVKLHSDFSARSDMTPEELRLAYVAITRARQTLDLSAWTTQAAPVKSRPFRSRKSFSVPVFD